MKPFSPTPAISHVPQALRARKTLALHDQVGQRIACLDGQVWITQQHDQRDVVLQPGECFVLDRAGLAIVFALQDAILTVGPQRDGETCLTC